MDLREIEAICAVNAYQNYSEAAFHSSSSPSVISKQIARVEDELGIRIFERATKSVPVKLTAEGEEIISYFKLIAGNYRQMQTRIQTMKVSSNESFSVGYQRHIGSFHERDLLAHFLLKNPSTTLSFVTCGTEELIHRLVNGTLSAAFISVMLGIDELKTSLVNLADPDFSIMEIFTCNQLSLGLPVSHPLAGEAVIRRDSYPRLYRETFLLPVEQRSDGSLFHRKNLAGIINCPDGIRIRYVDQNVPEVALELVEQGGGVLPQACIVPRQVGGVRFVPMEDAGFPVTTYFVFRKSRATPALLALKNSIAESAQSYRESGACGD